jgi:uncharacterized damage-inducible protein DinB
MPFSQTLLPEFDAEMKKTRKILECVPDGKFDYKPHPKSMSLRDLATHVAGLPSWTNFALEVEELDLNPDFKQDVTNSRAELLALFDKSAASARAKIEAATDADWQVIWTFKVQGKVVWAMPRAAVMRGSIMNHLIHHRAQLGVYLRLNDVAIPGMYGPSADEMSMFQAAAS